MPTAKDASESADVLLQPYLTALLRLSTASQMQNSQPTFTASYIETRTTQTQTPAPLDHFASELTSATEAAAKVLVSPGFSPLVSEVSDSAAKAGEGLFWAAITSLRARGIKPGKRSAALEDAGAGGGDTNVEDVWPTSLWPPLEAQDEDE
jgi:hypothetical protein